MWTRTFRLHLFVAALSALIVVPFAKSSGARIWIQHDAAASAKLKKSPEYYD